MRAGVEMKIRILNAFPLFDYREACKLTEGEEAVASWKPKDERRYWIKQFYANHSPIRVVQFRIIDTIPRSVAMQIVRHTKGHPFYAVQSSRPDWTGKPRSADPYEPKLICLTFTPESWLELCKLRLCNRTEKNTREIVSKWVQEMRESDNPLISALGACSVPRCEYMGGRCPELKSCGKCAQIDFDRI